MQLKGRVNLPSLHDDIGIAILCSILFADDLAFVTSSVTPEAFSTIINVLHEVFTEFGLTISFTKAKFLIAYGRTRKVIDKIFPAIGKFFDVNLYDGTSVKLERVGAFTYLGSTVHNI